MKIIDLTSYTSEHTLANYHPEKNYFIIASIQELSALSPLLTIPESSLLELENNHEDVRFESRAGFDFLRFKYYELQNKDIVFESFNLLFGANFIVFLTPHNGVLSSKFVDTFLSNSLPNFPQPSSIPYIYYQFLREAFFNMFACIHHFESILTDMETQILNHDKNYVAFSLISKIKHKSFRLKKYNRQLLYLGEQLILNDNNFIGEQDMRFFHNLDAKINILYEYSADLYEMGKHLTEVYDSRARQHTNNLLNKITILSALATPITIITGIYGMNFKNMPELESTYGYYITLAIIVLISTITLIILRRKKILKKIKGYGIIKRGKFIYFFKADCSLMTK